MKDVSKDILKNSIELSDGAAKSGRKAIRIITYVAATIMAAAVAVLVLFRLGVLYHEPSVKVQANNCYNETLIVVMDYDFAPFSYRNNDGTPSGHDVELINEIANRLEKNVDIRFLTYSECLEQIRSGEADIVMSTTFEEELDGIRNTLPVVSNSWIAFSKGSVVSVADVYGKQIGIISGAEPLKDFGLNEACKPFQTYTDAFVALENGELDCVIAKYPIGRKIIRDNGFSDIKATCEITGSHLSIGVKAGDTQLADQINEIIRQLSNEGFLSNLNEKWCGSFVSDFSFKDFIEYYPGLFFLASMIMLMLICLLIISSINRRTDRVLQNRMQIARDEKEAELKEQMARVMGLSDEFQAIFDVDAETGSYEIFSYDTAYFDDVLVKMEKGSDFYADTLKDVEKVVYSEDKDLIRDTFSNKEYIRKTLKEQGQFIIDYRLMSDNGPAWYRVKVVKKSGDDSHFLVGVFYTDERIRKEAEYKKNIEQGLKVINGLASDCVSLYTVNLDENTYNIYSITDDVKDISTIVEGFSNVSKALTQYADMYVHEEDRDKIYYFADLNHIREALKDTRSHKVMVRRNVNGEWVWIEMNMIKVEPVSEPARNVILAFTDRTRQVKEEMDIRQRLEDALSQAEAANKSKSTFLFNMSHDIRTPMNAILGFNDRAIKDIDNKEKALDSLRKVDLSGHSLLGIINDILDLSRIESGRVTFSRDISDMYRCFIGIEPMLRELADAKNIDLRFSFGEIKHRYNYVDFSHTERILVNVISNAIKYTHDGGKIDVSVCELDEEINDNPVYRFTVADNGQGMSEEFQKHMFEEFSREKNSTESGIQGTGIGLALVKSIVDKMGGRISCESRLGIGTTFWIDLPFEIRDNDVAVADVEESVSTDFSMNGKMFLLVEDNDLNREIAEAILQDEGAYVVSAENGLEAVEEVKKRGITYFDCILMDIQMPVMSGYEATSKIRELFPDEHVPIIALSANAFEEDRQKSIEAGMDDHVSKPIDIKKLNETLAKYL